MIPLVNGISGSWFAYMASAAFQATILALFILVVLRIGRRWPPALRHAILMLAICKFLFPPMLSLPTGVFDRILPQKWYESAPALNYVAPAVQHAVLPPRGIESSAGSASSLTNSGKADVESGTVRTLPAQELAITAKGKLLLLHFSGALLILTVAALQQLYLRRLAFRASTAKDPALENIYDALCRSMKLLRRPRLLISENNHAPVTFGAWKPVVILPQAIVAALPLEEIRVILGHELAHHRRRDPWVLWLQVIVSAIWWFNPVFWLLSWTVRSVREDCCDDMVVAAGIASRESYCWTLLQAARVACSNPVAGAALAYLGESQPLHRRFNRIMTAKSIAYPKLAGWGVLAVSALALLLLPGINPRALAQNAIRTEPRTGNPNTASPALSAELQTANSFSKAESRLPEEYRDSLPEETLNRLHESLVTAAPQAQSSRENAISEMFRKWLDEDVVYIITPEEKNGFLDLKTDKERDSYIEQFWARRYPSFKEEHYRRIAYANEHFTFGLAGWKTDRGRVYILWGKPDEIESHPSGGTYNRSSDEGGGTADTLPFEKWWYRHIDGVGDDIQIEFVDRFRTGEYQLAISPDMKYLSLNLKVFEQRLENQPANLESIPVNVFERMKVFFEKTDGH